MLSSITSSAPLSSTYPADDESTTAYETTYVDVGSTGYTTITATITATITTKVTATQTAAPYSTSDAHYAPPGFQVTTKYCAQGCGAGPTAVTVTVPFVRPTHVPGRPYGPDNTHHSHGQHGSPSPSDNAHHNPGQHGQSGKPSSPDNAHSNHGQHGEPSAPHNSPYTADLRGKPSTPDDAPDNGRHHSGKSSSPDTTPGHPSKPYSPKDAKHRARAPTVVKAPAADNTPHPVAPGVFAVVAPSSASNASLATSAVSTGPVPTASHTGASTPAAVSTGAASSLRIEGLLVAWSVGLVIASVVVLSLDLGVEAI